MEVPVALNFMPVKSPHKDLDYLPLADMDFQIKDLLLSENPLRIFFRCRDNYLNGSNIFGLWESNLPMYLLPSVHIFPELIHYCHANYEPDQRAVLSPSQSVLFPITAQSINEMLQFQFGQALTPLSMAKLLEKSTNLSHEELNRLCQTFMLPEHQPKIHPPYGYIFLLMWA